MDKAGEQQRLEGELRELESYLSSPITMAILSDNKEQQEAMLKVITNEDVFDVQTLVLHFQAIGHLRGLRRGYASVQERVAEIKEQLQAL